jgi:hypothetical protein
VKSAAAFALVALVAFVAFIAWIALSACDSAFDDAACELSTGHQEIEVKRDVPVVFALAPKLKVEACALREGEPPKCTTETPEQDVDAEVESSLDVGSATKPAYGKLVRTADGKTRLELKVKLGEGAPSSTTTLVVKVKDETEREIVKAEGPIRWSDESCDRQPDRRSI